MESEKKLSAKELVLVKARMKAELENRTFAERFELAAKKWTEKKGSKPPIYKDRATGKLLWANRAMRRANKK